MSKALGDGIVYIIKDMSSSVFKVGFTRDEKTLHKRVNYLQIGNPNKLNLEGYYTDCGVCHEKFLHKLMKQWSLRGEWFRHNLIIDKLLYPDFDETDILDPLSDFVDDHASSFVPCRN